MHSNPLLINNLLTRNTIVDRFVGTGSADVDLLEMVGIKSKNHKLNYKINLSYSTTSANDKTWIPAWVQSNRVYLLEGTGAKVIAAFNNISNSQLLDIPNPIDCDCIIAGDDQEAKDTAKAIIEKIPDIRVIDAGKLEKSQLIEAVTPLLIGLNIKYKSPYGGFRITGIPKLDE